MGLHIVQNVAMQSATTAHWNMLRGGLSSKSINRLRSIGAGMGATGVVRQAALLDDNQRIACYSYES